MRNRYDNIKLCLWYILEIIKLNYFDSNEIVIASVRFVSVKKDMTQFDIYFAFI